jgi:peroxiredoxin Q/BCP
MKLTKIYFTLFYNDTYYTREITLKGKNLMNNLKKLLIITLVTLCLPVSATELTVGDEAPDFNLQATDGKFYKLKDYLGKQTVVLAWYPMANTRGCTFECKSLVEKGHLIREYNVSYVMASVDPLADNIDFAKNTGADFPMLSDPTKQAAKAYDVLGLFKVANRVTFYISKEGKILHIDDNISPRTAAEDIVKQLEVLAIDKVK